jgi:hypothetical protein
MYHQASYQSMRVWKSDMGTGYQDGPLETALFSRIVQIGTDSRGDLILLDQGNQRIRKILLDTSMVLTYAGTGIPGFQAGIGHNATFTHLRRMTLHHNDIYLIDQDWIRHVDEKGIVTNLLQATPDLDFRDLTMDNGTLYIIAATLDTQRNMNGCHLYKWTQPRLEIVRESLCSSTEQSLSLKAFRGTLYFSRSGAAALYTIQGSQMTKWFGVEGVNVASDGSLVSATTCFVMDSTWIQERLYFVSQCDPYLSLRVVDHGSVQSISRTLHPNEPTSIASVGNSLYFLEGQKILTIDL